MSLSFCLEEVYLSCVAACCRSWVLLRPLSYITTGTCPRVGIPSGKAVLLIVLRH